MMTPVSPPDEHEFDGRFSPARRQRLWILAGMCAAVGVFFLTGLARLKRDENAFAGPRGVLWDVGHYYYTVDQIQRGAVIYNDTFWTYGPIPPILYAIVLPRNFGQIAYWRLQLVLAAIGWLIGVLMVQERLRMVGATVIAGGLLWWKLMPKSDIVGAYYYLEVIAIFGFAWLYRHPEKRDFRWWLCAGGVLFFAQGVKFGSAIIMAVGLFALDAAVLWRVATGRRRLIAGHLCLGAGIVCSSILQWAMVALRSDCEIATQSSFPLYLKAGYDAMRHSRVPSITNVPEFATTQLPILCGLIVGLVLYVARVIGHRAREREVEWAVLLAAWYLVAHITGYLGSPSHYYAYGVCVLPACPAIFATLRVGRRGFLYVACGIYGCYATGYAQQMWRWVQGREASAAPVAAQRFYFDANRWISVTNAQRPQLEALASAIRDAAGGDRLRPMLVLPLGSGISYFLGVRLMPRLSWFLAQRQFTSADIRTAKQLLGGSFTLLVVRDGRADDYDIRMVALRACFDAAVPGAEQLEKRKIINAARIDITHLNTLSGKPMEAMIVTFDTAG